MSTWYGWKKELSFSTVISAVAIAAAVASAVAIAVVAVVSTRYGWQTTKKKWIV